MPAPVDTSRMAKALLEPDERELVDHATSQPDGQYDDGSWTFAWPGVVKSAYDHAKRAYLDERPLKDRMTFIPLGLDADVKPTVAWPGILKDGYESILRTYLDAGLVPVPGAPPGTKWSSGLDGLNVAGLAPMGTLGGRAVRAIKDIGELSPVARRAADGASHLPSPGSDVRFGSRNANIYDPPPKELRPFEKDYPSGARADDAGRLTHTIDGDPIISGATVVGRKVVGGGDEALPPEELDAIAERLFGQRPQMVPRSDIPGKGAGSFSHVPGADGPGYDIRVDEALRDAPLARVTAHEIAHGVDYLANWRSGIPQDGIKKQIGSVYNTLNNPNRSRDGLEAATWSKTARPQDFGYKGADIPAEYMAEAIRAYMADPNYIKSVAPETAARIREYVNTNPRINKTIQFNANDAGAGAGAALPALGVDPETQDILQRYGISSPDEQSASDDPSYDSGDILGVMRHNQESEFFRRSLDGQIWY